MIESGANLPVKAMEFESAITQEGQIALPPEVAGEIPVGAQLRVVVMWEPSNHDSEWRTVGRRRFEAAFCPEDAIYEKLMDDAATR